MNNAIYSAASGMMAHSRRLERTANNLANARTAGFRADQVSFELAPVPAGLTGSLTTGIVLAQPRPYDRRQGHLTPTGRSLDLALEGPGFFEVSTAAGRRYTRAGSFRLDEGRRIVTADGDPVLSQDGEPIVLPQGRIMVTRDGSIRVVDIASSTDRVSSNPAAVAQFSIVDFPGGAPVKVGATLLEAPAGIAPVPASPVVRQENLESSNVEPLQEMVALVRAQRAFESYSRVTQMMLQTVERLAANDIGAVS